SRLDLLRFDELSRRLDLKIRGSGLGHALPAQRYAGRMLTSVRVLLADDHQSFLTVVTRLLQPEFEVVTTVGDGEALIVEAATLVPDGIVLGMSMPKLNGIEAARRLKAAGSTAKIVFLTVHEDLDYVRGA